MKAKRNGYKGSLEQFSFEVQQQIEGIAKKNNWVISKRTLSEYGETNPREFFAETFANSQLGNPTSYGRAMQVWLEENQL